MAWNTRRGTSNSAAAAARPAPIYRPPPPINFSRFAGFANAAVLELFIWLLLSLYTVIIRISVVIHRVHTT